MRSTTDRSTTLTQEQIHFGLLLDFPPAAIDILLDDERCSVFKKKEELKNYAALV